MKMQIMVFRGNGCYYEVSVISCYSYRKVQLKYLVLLISLISLSACGKPNLASCLEDVEAAKKTFPLKTEKNRAEIFKAVKTDQKYGSCFVEKLKISRTDSLEKQAQAVLDYTSTTIVYEADKSEGFSDDLDRPGTRLPSRTVADGKGDCEDKSALAVVMLNELGFDTFVIKRPPIDKGLGHILLGIRADYDTGLQCGDDFFIAFDPTLKGAKLGDKGAGLSKVKKFQCGRI